jgi:glutaminyl-peptide cyclotransferase
LLNLCPITRLRRLRLFVEVLAAAASIGVFPSPGYSDGTARIVHIYPHDPTAFTQGLLFHKGFFYESTGLNGRSSVRKVVPETGEVVQKIELPGQYFGEGLARWGDRLGLLTLEVRTRVVLHPATFKLFGNLSYAMEGWGLNED